MQNQLLFDSQVKAALSTPVYVFFFYKKNNKAPPHFDKGIWRRRFHFSFSVHTTHMYAEVKRNNHRSFWICAEGKLGQEITPL